MEPEASKAHRECRQTCGCGFLGVGHTGRLETVNLEGNHHLQDQPHTILEVSGGEPFFSAPQSDSMVLLNATRSSWRVMRSTESTAYRLPTPPILLMVPPAVPVWGGGSSQAQDRDHSPISLLTDSMVFQNKGETTIKDRRDSY
jgi:hypothetical protein